MWENDLLEEDFISEDEEEEDFYSNDYRDKELLENDEITPDENGFMVGWEHGLD